MTSLKVIAPLQMINGVGEAGWRLFTCPSVGSTNDLARDFPPWSAVRADVQAGGRGRFGRAFVSDEGGLWISAVLPAPGEIYQWAGFSLMVGYHLVQMLEKFAVPGIRLRWPNDLMVGKKKLGGLLIEQPSQGLLIIGLGLNVNNAPWKVMPELESVSTSLERVLTTVPDLRELTIATLDALANAHKMMLEHGIEAAIQAFNNRWSSPVPVEVVLSQGIRTFGQFTGLDLQGNLRFLDDFNSEFLIEHQRVEKFIELS